MVEVQAAPRGGPFSLHWRSWWRLRGRNSSHLGPLANALQCRWGSFFGIFGLALLWRQLAWECQMSIAAAFEMLRSEPFDFEWAALVEGERALVKREGVGREEVLALLDAATRDGFTAEVVPGRLGCHQGSAAVDDSRRLRTTVLVARDEDTLATALELEAAENAGGAADVTARLGELLGYPRCCVAEFCASQDPGDDFGHLIRSLAAGERVVPLGNSTFPIRPASHRPCRSDCPATLDLTRRGLDRLARARGRGRAREFLTWLALPTLYLNPEHGALFSGRWRGARLTIAERASRVADRDLETLLDAATALSVAPDGITFHTPAGPRPLRAAQFAFVDWRRRARCVWRRAI